jgi:hypothetical protein
VQFIDTAHRYGKKVVYIGFGSIVVSDPRAMTKCVIDAVVQSGVYAILSKGWSDRLHVKTGDANEPEEPLPPQIYAIQSIPHDWLFQRIDATCHHGGTGTTGASLRGKNYLLYFTDIPELIIQSLQLVFRLLSSLSLAINSFGLTGLKPLELAPALENLQ